MPNEGVKTKDKADERDVNLPHPPKKKLLAPFVFIDLLCSAFGRLVTRGVPKRDLLPTSL
jgi:hypothetical protein